MQVYFLELSSRVMFDPKTYYESRVPQSARPDPVIDIYTDGACAGNPGPGGWAVVVLRDGQEFSLSGNEPRTTNNRMELLAAINALEALPSASAVRLFTDSQYVVNGVTKWIPNWIKHNWVTKKKTPVKNRDLWIRLHAVAKGHTVQWRWVRGHAGNKYNEAVDILANAAKDAVR